MRRVFLRAAARYREWSPLYYYARGKTLIDPAYPAAIERLKDSEWPLLDLGCGMGLLAACLREAGHRPRIVGVDLDEKKVAVANQVLTRENMEFHQGNALDFPPHRGDVMMLDVLHYFSDAEQHRILQRIAECVPPGGQAILRTTLRQRNLRYFFTLLEEAVVHGSGWIPSRGTNFATLERIVAPFREAGLACEVRPMWGWTPFNGYLFTFRRDRQKSERACDAEVGPQSKRW